MLALAPNLLEWVKDLPPIRHFLTEVNENDRQGVCAVCGPVEIRKNGPSKWRCKTIVAQEYQRNVQRATDRFYEYLCTQVCSDCGESDPIVIQFDHTEDNKEYDVSDMVRKGYAWETILREIEKCDPVCANCHVRRTNQRGNFYRHVRAQCSRGG